MKLPNKVYDILKWVCLVAMPATATLYWTLSGIWGWPYAEQVIGTIAAVETFMGAIIGVSTRAYYRDESNAGE